MSYCLECRRQITREVDACPHCGAILSSSNEDDRDERLFGWLPRRIKILHLMLILAGIVVGVATTYFVSGNQTNKEAKKEDQQKEEEEDGVTKKTETTMPGEIIIYTLTPETTTHYEVTYRLVKGYPIDVFMKPDKKSGEDNELDGKEWAIALKNKNLKKLNLVEEFTRFGKSSGTMTGTLKPGKYHLLFSNHKGGPTKPPKRTSENISKLHVTIKKNKE